MVKPEWSPNESYLTKLERLAFALVRTKPVQDQSCDIRRRKNLDLWVEKCKGLTGPFALALLVAIPYIAENSSGSIIVASLLLAAIDASLTVWCYTDFESQHGHCPGDLFTCMFNNVGEFPAFLYGWWWISAMSAGFAACAKTLSAIMDSVTGRHVETLMENTVGSFTPFGAPIDIISVGVISVPAIMCCYPSLGIEESNFLQTAIFALTSTAALTIFGYAVATNHSYDPAAELLPPHHPEGSLYAKIIAGAALACVGFLGLYTVSKPENLTLTQHKHFYVSKRFSLTGCVVSSAAFIVYFIESTVINKVQQMPSLWDGDPPLLWPLDGAWRLIVAALAIAALSLTTFEFIVPLSLSVTAMANDGLLYRKLRKMTLQDDTQKWRSTTPLMFGAISALQAMLLDTKVLLGLIASSLLCIHILVCTAMIATRYKVPNISTVPKRAGHTQTRPTRPNSSNSEGGTGNTGGARGGEGTRHPTRRLLAVSFLKSGLGKIPREVVHEIEVCRSGRESVEIDANSDRAYLMQDVDTSHAEPQRRRESASEFSLGSNVSGYESDTDHGNSDDTDDTDIDAVVTEYQEHVRVATLNGVMPMYPTPATSRRVALSLLALVPCCLALAASFNRVPMGQFTGIMLGVSSGLLTFLLLVVISRQPQRRRMFNSNKSQTQTPSGPIPPPIQELENTSSPSALFENSFIPWIPAAAVLLHCCLLLQSLDLAATPFAFWLATGLIIYFSYSVTKSVAAPNFTIPTERICLNATPRHSPNQPSTSTTSTGNSEPYAQIDTLLLA